MMVHQEVFLLLLHARFVTDEHCFHMQLASVKPRKGCIQDIVLWLIALSILVLRDRLGTA
jgi:hypothetical protein